MGVTVRTPEVASIYGLYDRDGNLRYIGKAKDPEKRLKGHMRELRRRTPLYDWLRKHGAPEMRVLETDCPDWVEAETRLIAEARLRGERLLNIADGGNQPHTDRQVLSKNAKRTNARVRADPLAFRVKEIKRRLTTAWRRGELSDYAKSRMREAARIDPVTFGSFGRLDWEGRP